MPRHAPPLRSRPPLYRALTPVGLGLLLGLPGASCESAPAAPDSAAEARIAELEAELTRAAELLESGMNVQFSQVPLGEAPPAIRERLEQQIAAQPGFAGAAHASADRRAPLPASARALQSTVWTAGPDEDGAFVSLHFGETSVGVRTEDSPLAFAAADFSGVHPGCLGQGLCVALQESGGAWSIQHYALDEDERVLRPMQCVDWREVGEGEEVPSAEALLASSGSVLVRRQGDILCLRPSAGLELTLHAGELP